MSLQTSKLGFLILFASITLGAPVLAACAPSSQKTIQVASTPTIDPAIYNQVPETRVFELGQCTAELNAPASAYTSTNLGGQPSGEIPPGKYQVGVGAKYSTSLWYSLNNVGPASYINSADIASLTGDCSVAN